MKMTKTISRRTFTKMAGAAGAVSTLALTGCATPVSGAKARVVVVGGGFGGATTAKYIRKLDPAISVTLIEPKKRFATCPFSNTVIAGLNDISFISHGYDALSGQHGVNVVHDTVTEVDAARRTVKLSSGGTIGYEKLVLSPGIDFKYDEVEGYGMATSAKLPHAWNGGPQTILLRNQLMAMPDGGTFIIAPPANPFRCPPGPYERVSLIAHYLKNNKPKSKILILDAKTKFSKQGLFMEGWKALYGDMIEWVALDQGGGIERVDPDTMMVYTDFGEHKGDVINFIPGQKAAQLAHVAGAADSTGWCPINPETFESTLLDDVHVIGDSSIASPLPKSGFAANSEGKACAAAVVKALTGKDYGVPSMINTCYSLVAPDYGISVAMVYGFADGKITKVEGSGGVSPTGAPKSYRRDEARYASGWYKSITADIWG
jgi:sulfide dehydrogenase [flavocytochrome c] flavoprotein subunit